MDLTTSYERVMPHAILARYRFLETRNAAAVLVATDPDAWDDLVAVLSDFALIESDVLTAGGQETSIAARLNSAFRERGWREGRVDTHIRLSLRLMPYRKAGESTVVVTDTEVSNEGYMVDNVIRRVALDVEWNAKDGNLDRDLAAYRALYDAGLIDVSVMVTRDHYDLRTLGRAVAEWRGDEESMKRWLNTTTSTNSEKLRPRMTRGDAGGSPLLAALIEPRTYDGEMPPGFPDARDARDPRSLPHTVGDDT